MVDHDRLFKELLRTFFSEFVELFLPEVAGYMERNHLEFLDKEVLTDIASGERHVVDLLVKARIRQRILPTWIMLPMPIQSDLHGGVLSIDPCTIVCSPSPL